jgi:hypothetical protein
MPFQVARVHRFMRDLTGFYGGMADQLPLLNLFDPLAGRDHDRRAARRP